MNENEHIIVINGRRYNAKTGENLSRQSEPVRIVAAATVHKPAPHKADQAAQKPARKAAAHAPAHHPNPARTLMRQGVKKPSATLKRRIRVQGQIEQPHIEIYKVAERPATGRTPRHVVKGRLIHHFSPSLFITVTETAPARERSLVSDHPILHDTKTSAPTMRPAFAPRKPRNTSELLDYAVRYADSPQEAEEPARHRHPRKRLHRRAHATAR